ncbi:response regulator [Motiliproteus sp. MSK22-1]|uniref:response regulator n=1 Tax=Motiliproteus sp. MSK22-1 TaxID=1897630 RepID=UPI000978ABE0|nr:response regulator [Motiliproteus sp. MSK22-1]OMH33927.1 hypothetical protein BGP75_13230 [Motiliproteus sp. MSK22-1]
MDVVEGRSSEQQENSASPGFDKNQDNSTKMDVTAPLPTQFPVYKQLPFKLISPLLVLLILSLFSAAWLSFIEHQHNQGKLISSKASGIIETISALINTPKFDSNLNKLVTELSLSEEIDFILIVSGNPAKVQYSSQQYLAGVPITEISNRLIPETLRSLLSQQTISPLRQLDGGQLFIATLTEKADKSDSAVVLSFNPKSTSGEITDIATLSTLMVLMLFLTAVVILYIQATRLLKTPIQALQDRLTNKKPVDTSPIQDNELGILIQQYEKSVSNSLLSEHHHEQVLSKLKEELVLAEKHGEQAVHMNSILKQRNKELLQKQQILETKDEAREQFISGKTRDVCSHLSNILKSTYRLKEQSFPPEQQELIAQICNEGNSIYSKIHDISNFSKTDAGIIASENNSKPAADNENTGHDTDTGKPIKVLLVEDYPVNQTVAQCMLQKLNCNVELAENGQQALDCVQAQEYDLVLMDCQMPVMDGYEASQQIRALGNKIKQPPIVAATAHALVGDRQRCLDTGMDDFISKPIQLEELSRIVKQWGSARTKPSIRTSQSSTADSKEHSPHKLHAVEASHAIEASRKEQEPEETTSKNTQDNTETEQIFDKTALSGRLNNDKPLMEAVLQVYIRDSGKLLEQLSLASSEKNENTVSELSHRLKGSSANVGANALCSLSADLYQASKIPDWPRVVDLLAESQDTFEEFKRVSKENA